MIRSVVLLALLCGCAAHPPAGLVMIGARPAALLSCPHAAAEPQPPRKPRTIEQVGAYALRLDIALRETERARAVCAARLERLNEWIDGGMLAAK